MGERIAKSFAFLGKHAGPLLGLTCLMYLPYFALYRGSVEFGLLPEDAASAFFGLVDILIAPMANGAAVFMMNRWVDGESVTIKEALVAAKGAWTRLLVAYVSVAFIMLGWLAVTVIPCYAILQIAGLNQPLILVPLVAVVISYVMARYSFLDPLVVVDGMGAYHARSRSADLVKGHLPMILGLGLLSYMPPMVLELGSEALSGAGVPVDPGFDLRYFLMLAGPLSVFLYLWPQTLFFLYYRELKLRFLNPPAPKEVA